MFEKEKSDKELYCRYCSKFLDKHELKKGNCPDCGSDENVFINDLKIDK